MTCIFLLFFQLLSVCMTWTEMTKSPGMSCCRWVDRFVAESLKTTGSCSQMVNNSLSKIPLKIFAIQSMCHKGTNVMQYLCLHREWFPCWWEDFALVLIMMRYLTLTTGWFFPDSLISCILASSMLFVVPLWSHLGFGDIVRPVIAISSGLNDSDRSLVLRKTFVCRLLHVMHEPLTLYGSQSNVCLFFSKYVFKVKLPFNCNNYKLSGVALKYT